jgi:hypothetical protein
MQRRDLGFCAGLLGFVSVCALAQGGSGLMGKLQTIDLFSPDMVVAQSPLPPPPPALSTSAEPMRAVASDEQPSTTVAVATTEAPQPASAGPAVVSVSGPGTAPQWAALRREFGIAEGWNPQKKLLVASAAVVAGARPGQPDFVQSRIIAFEKAELQAKAELAQFMASTLGGKSELKVFEGPENLQAAADLAAAAGRGIAVEEFQSELSQTAAGMLTGAQVLATFEAPVEGGYEVRAVVAWSENLKRLATVFANASEYRLALKGAGKPLAEVVPCAQPELMVHRFGTKIHVDETGKMQAVSYGQAAAKIVSKDRSAAAVSRAADKARLSALSALRRFLGEEQALSRRFAEREKIVEREGAESPERILESLYSAEFKSASEAIDISGAATFCTWHAKHPVTGEDVVGAVVTLSSEAQAAAAAMRDAMDSGQTGPAGDEDEAGDDPW